MIGSLLFSFIPIENVHIQLIELWNIFARPTMGWPRISGNANHTVIWQSSTVSVLYKLTKDLFFKANFFLLRMWLPSWKKKKKKKSTINQIWGFLHSNLLIDQTDTLHLHHYKPLQILSHWPAHNSIIPFKVFVFIQELMTNLHSYKLELQRISILLEGPGMVAVLHVCISACRLKVFLPFPFTFMCQALFSLFQSFFHVGD